MNKITILLLLLSLLIGFPEILKSQGDIFIPYRDGKLWGYADTTSKIVIPSVYNKVIKQKKGMFHVKKGAKEGVVTFGNEVVVPFEEKNKIFLTDEYILSQRRSYQNGQSKISKVYRSIISGKKTFPNEISLIDEIELVNKKYYKVQTKTGKQGLVKVAKNFEGIEKWYIDTSFIQIKSTWSLNFVLVEKDGIVRKFSPDFTLEEIDSLESVNYISEVPEEELLDEPESEKEYAPTPQFLSLLKLENQNSHHPIVRREWSDETGKKQIEFDTLKNVYSKIEIIDFRDYFIANQDSVDALNDRQKSIGIVSNNIGKKGVINSLGEQIIPIDYDSISNIILLEDCKTIHLICYKGSKCGVVDLRNKSVIPFEYDKLFMNTKMERRKNNYFKYCYKLKNGVIAKKADKFGIVNDQGSRLEFTYDKIEFIRITGSFQLVKNNKYGILQNERIHHWKKESIPEVLVDPVFSYPVDGVTEISGYLLGIVLNPGSRISGYVDTKGFNYFKN